MSGVSYGVFIICIVPYLSRARDGYLESSKNKRVKFKLSFLVLVGNKARHGDGG